VDSSRANTDQGLVYFFPWLFYQTPISVILLLLAGIVLCAVRWRRFLDHNVYVFLPLAHFWAGDDDEVNIGAAILPIQPFVLLLAGNAIAELYASQGSPFVCCWAPFTPVVIEFALVCPHYLAFFNNLPAPAERAQISRRFQPRLGQI